MNDTTPEIEKLVTEKMKRLSGIERLKMGASMFDMVKRLAVASLSRGEDKENLRRLIFLRFYGNDFDAVTKQKIIAFISKSKG